MSRTSPKSWEAKLPRANREPNTTQSVIRADELYTLEEAARRLRWRQHSIRQARCLGLRIIRFGSRNYVAGSAVLAFFEHLAELQQAK